MPPEVTATGPGNFRASTLIDKDVLNSRALLESVINNLLRANQLATSLAFISCDDDLAAGVDNTVAERVGRETSKDNGVNCTNTDTGHESNDGLGNHGKVDSNGVALADAHLLENPGSTRDLSEELSISDITTLGGLVGLVNDGNTIRVLESMTVDTVV